MQQTGKVPPELQDLPELPECAARAWRWFQELSGRRTSGGFAVNPITWPDIDSWMRVTGAKPQRWELDAIAVIDDAFRASLAPQE